VGFGLSCCGNFIRSRSIQSRHCLRRQNPRCRAANRSDGGACDVGDRRMLVAARLRALLDARGRPRDAHHVDDGCIQQLDDSWTRSVKCGMAHGGHVCNRRGLSRAGNSQFLANLRSNDLILEKVAVQNLMSNNTKLWRQCLFSMCLAVSFSAVILLAGCSSGSNSPAIEPGSAPTDSLMADPQV
jgi:hypothetical protein